MSLWSRMSHHERLMSRMADANDADLDLALQCGDLGLEEYRSAVLSCMGCSDASGCERLLSEKQGGIPDFCRNGSMIRRLSEH